MTRARDLSKLSGPSVFTIDASSNVGVGTTVPDAKLDVIGVVSATSYYGDGSNLDNVTSTTINNNAARRLVTGSDSANTLNAESGLTWVSGSGTLVATAFSGSGESLTGVASTDNIITSTAATMFSINSTGIITASGGFSGNITGTGATFTSITGDLTGDVTGNASGTAGGLSGTPSITVQDITATTISVGGTLTYEDVTNVDSVGLITARKGIIVSGVSTFLGSQQGINVTSGLSTFHNVSGNVVATAATVGSAVTVTGSGIDIHSGAGITAGTIGKASFTTFYGDGSNLTNLPAAGVGTEASVSSGVVVTLDLSKQDHKVTATGIVTFTTTGGTEADSHTLRSASSGISTSGFSTYFLWPSGSPPNFNNLTDGSIQLVSFTVQRAGQAGIGTQLLDGASFNFS